MKKSILLLTAVFVLTLFGTVMAASYTGPAIKAKLASEEIEGDFMTVWARNFSDHMKKWSGGKIDIEDLPVLAQLHRLGLCVMPKFLPPWAADIRFLLCYLTYSSFLNEVDLSKVKLHYRQLLESMPRIQ